jgi:hypothetical protein
MNYWKVEKLFIDFLTMKKKKKIWDSQKRICELTVREKRVGPKSGISNLNFLKKKITSVLQSIAINTIIAIDHFK